MTDVICAIALGAGSLGAMTPGSPFAAGLTLDGNGRAYAVRAGSAGQAVTGAPTTGLATLRLGNSHAGTSPLNGGITLIQVSPTVLSDGALDAQVGGLVP